MKINAAVLNTIGAESPYAESMPLTIQQVNLDPPGDGEVLVKIVAAGLCHSDLSVINGSRPRPTPMVLGHEASGIVEELGAHVDDLVVGDHVVMVFVPSCGHCLPCAGGRPALCEPGAAANTAGELLSGAKRLHYQGENVNHHLGVSAFAEYATVSRRSIVKINKSLPLDEAALFGCAVLTGVGAVVNTAGIKAGASVAVIGLGGVGLSALLGARAAGAREIIAVDLDEDKLALAKDLGATHCVNARMDNCVEAVRDITHGGVEFAFEFAGSIPALETAYQITRRGGTTVTAGLPHPDKRLSIAPVQLVAEERTLKGSYIGTCVPTRDLPNYIAMYQNGLLPVNKLMSGNMPLADINQGFDLLAQAKVIRQIITP
jgi:alcohol dehydrogenase